VVIIPKDKRGTIMKTQAQLERMDENELIREVLVLQKQLKDVSLCKYKSSLIHSYHFSGNELLTCDRERMMGSGVIMALYDLSGKVRVQPVMMKDGLSKEAINALLDDMQYSYDQAIAFKPVSKRL
jgi:hypothetical protein